MKLLILSTSTGSGHLKAAEAVRLYVEKHHPEVEVKEVDYLKYVGLKFDKVVSSGYLEMVKLVPGIYGKLYNKAKRKSLKKMLELLDRSSISKMEKLIDEFKPDVLLCTHPFPLETASILKEKNSINLPIIATITDYTVHPKWIYDNVDAYIIPNEDFMTEIIELGVPKEKVYPLGIPVNEKFFGISEQDKNSFRSRLGLKSEVPVVLIMCGGLGLVDISEVFEDVLSSKENFQVIACVGKNKEMLSDLENLYKEMNTDKKAIVMGYTEEINLLMSISDLLISKPGGLTVTEAMHMRLPILIKSPIPGQEEENTEYLLNCGIALCANNLSTRRVVENLLFSQSSKRIDYIKQMQAEKTKESSVENIYKLIVNILVK